MKHLQYDFTEVRDHEDLFKKPFAKHGRYKVGFGVPKKSADNAVDVQWSFTTPDSMVETVSYHTGSYVTNGGRVMIISDHLDAELGDEGIVGTCEVENGKPANRLSMFVNDTSTDPKPVKVRDGTHGGAEYEVDRTTWLDMNKQYYGRLYRTDLREDAMHPAMALETASVE